MSNKLNLQTRTCNPLLEPIELLCNQITFAKPNAKAEAALNALLEPVLATGCSYTAWECALILARAAGSGMSFPNHLMLDKLHMKLYKECNLSDFSEVGKGYMSFEEDRNKKTALAKQLKQLLGEARFRGNEGNIQKYEAQLEGNVW